MGFIVAALWQQFGEKFQGKEARGTRNYGATESSNDESTKLRHFEQIERRDDQTDGETRRTSTNWYFHTAHRMRSTNYILFKFG